MSEFFKKKREGTCIEIGEWLFSNKYNSLKKYAEERYLSALLMSKNPEKTKEYKQRNITNTINKMCSTWHLSTILNGLYKKKLLDRERTIKGESQCKWKYKKNA